MLASRSQPEAGIRKSAKGESPDSIRSVLSLEDRRIRQRHRAILDIELQNYSEMGTVPRTSMPSAISSVLALTILAPRVFLLIDVRLPINVLLQFFCRAFF